MENILDMHEVYNGMSKSHIHELNMVERYCWYTTIGYVYIAEFEGVVDQIKIGSTHSPFNRMAELEEAYLKSNCKVTRVAISRPIVNYASVEHQIHAGLSQYRKKHTEMFYLTFDKAMDIVQNMEQLSIELPYRTYAPRREYYDGLGRKPLMAELFNLRSLLLKHTMAYPFDNDQFVQLTRTKTTRHVEILPNEDIPLPWFIDYVIARHLSISRDDVISWFNEIGLTEGGWLVPSPAAIGNEIIIPHGKNIDDACISANYCSIIATAIYYDLIYGHDDLNNGVDGDGFTHMIPTIEYYKRITR